MSREVTESLEALRGQVPAIAWPETMLGSAFAWGRVKERWPMLRQACEAAAAAIAHGEPLHEHTLPTIARAFMDAYMVFAPHGEHAGNGIAHGNDAQIAHGDEHEYVHVHGYAHERGRDWIGMLALIAGVCGDWDLVATMTGGPLPASVSGNPVFSGNTTLLARHIAVVARTGAVKHARALMAELRQSFETPFEICVALATARIYFERAVRAPDLDEALREWLDGRVLEDPPAAIAMDTQVAIFERYMPELSDARAHAYATELLQGDARSAEVDSAAVLLFVSGEDLPDGWIDRVDPVIAELLGAPSASPALPGGAAPPNGGAGVIDEERKRHSLVDLKMRARLFRAVSNIPLAVPANLAHALIAHDEPAILMITGRGTLAPFRAGQMFGDDFRAFGRYLLAAQKARAPVSSVEPAWKDFLAHRSPRTSRLELTWRDLILFQRAITNDLGAESFARTGEELRRAITGR
ncbi:MAG: hypothetical protein QM831_00610 [Kofleriaceae bacterium]